jgi:hypothetical protein
MSSSVVRISDDVRVAKSADRFSIQEFDSLSGDVSTIRVYTKAEALALAKELSEWAETQPEIEE